MLPLILATVVAATAAQSTGSSTPISTAPANICGIDPGSFVADQNSVCYYHQCVPSASGLVLRPRRCALGSFVASNFVNGLFNPCTERFPIVGVYNCDRLAAAPVDNCLSKLDCKNGGQARQEGSLCWCNCTAEFQGSPDCSVRKGTTLVPPTGLPCPTGEPLDDWCGKALPNRANPCQNGGVCVNQCTNFWCNCTAPYIKDRLCAA